MVFFLPIISLMKGFSLYSNDPWLTAAGEASLSTKYSTGETRKCSELPVRQIICFSSTSSTIHGIEAITIFRWFPIFRFVPSIVRRVSPRFGPMFGITLVITGICIRRSKKIITLIILRKWVKWPLNPSTPYTWIRRLSTLCHRSWTFYRNEDQQPPIGFLFALLWEPLKPDRLPCKYPFVEKFTKSWVF